MSHSHNVDWKSAFTVEELPQSEVKITGELPYAELQSERTAAITKLGKHVELDGFRKGHVPTPVLEKHLGEMAILSEMAERAIAHSYPHIVQAHELDVIGQPQIEVTKLAPDNPLGLTITVATVPAITLPDYKAIAADVNKNRPSDDISDEELEEKIKEIQTQKRAYDRMQELSQLEQDEAKDSSSNEGDLPTPTNTDLPTPESEATKTARADIDKKYDENAPLPELTDEYVKGLGQSGQFETVKDFRTKLLEHVKIEKERDNHAKHRAAITDAIIEKVDITLPKVLIDSEIAQMWAQMTDDIARSNLKMEDYLKHIKKSEDDLKAEWTPAAEKRASLQLVLNEIAKKEEMMPEKEVVETQTKELMERFKDADENRVKLYVASMLLNEEVMKMLESQ
jgi:trigger factor